MRFIVTVRVIVTEDNLYGGYRSSQCPINEMNGIQRLFFKKGLMRSGPDLNDCFV